MERRKFTREFKLEAVRLIKDRRISYGQASEDIGVHKSQLRDWVKKFAADPPHAFPGNGHIKPERLEIARLESFFSSLKTKRTARKPYRHETKQRLMCSTTSNASTIQNAGIRRLDI